MLEDAHHDITSNRKALRDDRFCEMESLEEMRGAIIFGLMDALVALEVLEDWRGLREMGALGLAYVVEGDAIV